MANSSNKIKGSMLLSPQSTAPASGQNGELYNNTTNGLQVMRRGAWQTVQTTDNPSARFEDSSTTISGSLADIVWTTTNWDTHQAMDATTATQWTAPQTGYYLVSCQFRLGGTFALNTVTELRIEVNNGRVASNVKYSGGAVTNEQISITDLISMSAGDVLNIALSCGATSPTISAGSDNTYLSIVKVGGPITG